MKHVVRSWPSSLPTLFVLCLVMLDPGKALAVPSYARQTGLSCSACHYTPPELNAAGRRFKLTGYVDKEPSDKGIHVEPVKAHGGLDLFSHLPLSVMFETSYSSTKTAQPDTQNGNFEFPQDFSLFLSGAWTSHVGSFFQVTYDVQDDHFSIDNTDVRYANKGKLGGKELVYGVTLNNNPTVEDLWNTTPAWAFPWVVSDFAPTPTAAPIIQGGLAGDVAGLGAYAMWNDHLYAAVAGYRTQHVGGSQPNPGTDSAYNIQGLAPYWRVAWQQASAKTQFEIGTYGIHVASTPNAVTGPRDTYTDWAFDVQYDRSLHRRDVLSVRATYVDESSTLNGTFGAGGAQQASHNLHAFTANAEYHFGNRCSITAAWFDTWGTIDPLLYAPGAVSGSANGDPGSAGYAGNVSFWPVQNWQLAFQYTGYTHFNGASTNYDGSGRNASGNNTVYLVARFLF